MKSQIRWEWIIWAGAIGALVILAATCLQTSGFVNCVVVEKEEHFIGEMLAHSSAEVFGPLPLEECEALDRDLDGGDGPREGRVRWVECLKGPNCNETGDF